MARGDAILFKTEAVRALIYHDKAVLFPARSGAACTAEGGPCSTMPLRQDSAMQRAQLGAQCSRARPCWFFGGG